VSTLVLWLALAAAVGGALVYAGIREGSAAAEDWLAVATGGPLRAASRTAEQRLARARLQERLRRLLDQVGRQVGPVLGQSAALQRRLEWAGWSVGPEAFVAAQVLAAGAGLVAGAMLATAAGSPGAAVVFGPLGALCGWMVPAELLERDYRAARARVGREALGYGDFLIACLEAGLQLEQALVRLGRELPGRLAAMLARAAQEAAATREGIEGTLQRLADEVDEPSVSAVVGAIVQARMTGGDLARPLSSLLVSLRTERQQKVRAAARARAATSFMPLMFVFLPGVLVPIGFVVMRAFAASGF
jgi:tight adherence protein C